MCKPQKMGWADKKKPRERARIDDDEIAEEMEIISMYMENVRPYYEERKRRHKKKHYKLEYMLKEGDIHYFGWHKDWETHGKYATLADVEKAKRAMEKNTGFGHYKYQYRIVEL